METCVGLNEEAPQVWTGSVRDKWGLSEEDVYYISLYEAAVKQILLDILLIPNSFGREVLGPRRRRRQPATRMSS